MKPDHTPSKIVYNMHMTSEAKQTVAFARPVLVRDGVYEHLRLAILDGVYAPAERLGEVELGQKLGVSRTPIREALMRLSQDGLVQPEANKGMRVRTLNIAEAQETYRVRVELDGLAAELAAQHHTPEQARVLQTALRDLEEQAGSDYRHQTRLDLAFHRCIVSASHNSVLELLCRDLESRVALIKHQTRTYNADPHTSAQHSHILQAILDGDAAQARQAAQLHVRTFMELMLQELSPTAFSINTPAPEETTE